MRIAYYMMTRLIKNRNSKRSVDSDKLSATFADDAHITPEDQATLRKIPDKLPWSAFLVAVVELCERFAYYGLSGPFQNYISNKS